MSELVFFLEEPSAEAMLKGFLPQIVPPEFTIRYIVFDGKQDLEKQLVRKLRGYRTPDARFIVMRDKDSGDCRVIKSQLVDKCNEAGKPETLVRIACHELESWYLADLAAVEQGLGVKNLQKFQSKKQYASPDSYPSPSLALKKLVATYEKIGGSRAIGPFLDSSNTRSDSFRVFVEGIRKVCN
jgi:hypothetical protein